MVDRNNAAVDGTLARLYQVKVPDHVTSTHERRPAVPAEAPEFVQRVTSLMLLGEGDQLPVSAIPVDGTWPVGTTRWEKRNIALDVPVWDESICIQCGKCVLVCPHSVIRGKVYDPADLAEAPATFKSADARWPDRKHQKFTLQVAVEDCTGCRLCVEVCPVKNKSETKLKAINMRPVDPIRDAERTNWDFFLKLDDPDRGKLRTDSVKDVQLLEPLFEFSGACAGCGETPYLKLLSQLYGDRILCANATGCSSIYGGNLPTTPWTVNRAGRGPAWANSLFEDNAEFGLGMRLALDKQAEYARELVTRLQGILGPHPTTELTGEDGREMSEPSVEPLLAPDLARALLDADQSTEAGVNEQRARVAVLKQRLAALDGPEVKELLAVADALVRKSVWVIGGDGWAYDIGYGGVDHVVASGKNIKLLVLDTEVYSNTGGQMSKSTPRGAVAKFAAGGKRGPKKDLAMMAMTYGTVYVARVAMGGSDVQTLQAFREAEAYDGPALIIAYSHCIAHGYDMARGLDQQKAAVQSGYWPLIRYNPDLKKVGKNPLILDSKPPSLPLQKYIYNETRYTMLAQANPTAAKELLALAQEDVEERWRLYAHLAALPVGAAPVAAPGNGQKAESKEVKA
ncbi:MAG: thiamine pyrophosphate-dependent enzyme [Gemmataceae bacterium]